MAEASEEAQMSTAAQYETERMNLVKLNEKYEEEIQELRNKLSQERYVNFKIYVTVSLSSLSYEIRVNLLHLLILTTWKENS